MSLFNIKHPKLRNSRKQKRVNWVHTTADDSLRRLKGKERRAKDLKIRRPLERTIIVQGRRGREVYSLSLSNLYQEAMQGGGNDKP